MSDLLENIRAAQVRAGEDAVLDNLRAKGLLPVPRPDPTNEHTVEELQGQLAAMTEKCERYKRMYTDAVSSLATVDEALGIPELDAGGAAPILAAIQRLMFAAKISTPRDFIRDEAAVAASVARADSLREAVEESLEETAEQDRDTQVAAIVEAVMAFPEFQARVQPWMLECFDATIAADKQERNHRFLEESLETVQSGGCTASEAHQLVDYVFGRPVGELRQEVGGVMVTLAALCLAHGIDMHDAGEVELARIWTKVAEIRAKQAAKPKHSPLPQ